MKNRAKCKICKSVIESFHLHDLVSCSCGEISITGGTNTFQVSYKDIENFLRVDDEGNEIIVKEVTENEEVKPLYIENPTRDDKMRMLDDMITSYEALPKHALEAPVTGYDLVSVLLLVKSILSC